MDLLGQMIPLFVPIVVLLVRTAVKKIPGKYIPTIVGGLSAVVGLLNGDASSITTMISDAMHGAFTGLAGVGVAEIVKAPKRAATKEKG